MEYRLRKKKNDAVLFIAGGVIMLLVYVLLAILYPENEIVLGVLIASLAATVGMSITNQTTQGRFSCHLWD